VTPFSLSLSQNLVEFHREAVKEIVNQFSTATCAWQKTLLRPQTCELSAICGQRVRCGGLQTFVGKGKAFFDSLREKGVDLTPFSLCISACHGQNRRRASAS